jgi:hypothetical protein
MTSPLPVVHVCIATGQNAANLIPLEQLDAREVWILQTPEMKTNASHLKTVLKREDRCIERIDFDDRSPAALVRAAEDLAIRLDGRDVILHVTGGTKLMVLALSEQLRLIGTNASAGSLQTLYVDTMKQQFAWLGESPRTEPMNDVLNLTQMLLVQGYRIVGDNRHAEAQKRAQTRASLTRELGEGSATYAEVLSTLNWAARQAADEKAGDEDLIQRLKKRPSKKLTTLLDHAKSAGMLSYHEDSISFTDKQSAAYLCGGWLEEFVLLKLTGMIQSGRFSSNLKIESSGDKVRNEIDAMVIHRNRALIIECKTGRQGEKDADRIYKLAKLRDQLGGSVASALYLSAQQVDREVLRRAGEYRVDVLCHQGVSDFVAWLRNWRGS